MKGLSVLKSAISLETTQSSGITGLLAIILLRGNYGCCIPLPCPFSLPAGGMFSIANQILGNDAAGRVEEKLEGDVQLFQAPHVVILVEGS